MKNLSEKLVAGGFSLALLLLTGVGIASYLSVQRLIENKQRVEHTHQVLENLDKISDGLKDAQGARRGYILTREAIFIKTYRTGSQTTQKSLKAVRELTIDNPRQQRRIDEIEPLIAKRLTVLQQSIASLQQNKSDSQNQIDITNQGEKLQQELQGKLAAMDKEERSLLQQRSAATDASVKNTILVVVLGYSLSFVLLFGVYFLLKKEISDRTNAEAALKSSQRELKTLLENSPDIIIRVDGQLGHTYVNSALEREAKIPPAGFLGKTFSELGLPAELAEFLQASYQKVFATGEMNVVEFNYPSAQGVKSIQSLIAPEFAPDGSVTSTLSISRDITPLKQAQLALERANEELEMRVEERTAALLEINQALQAEIAERHQAEEALKQTAAELGDLYNNAPCGYHSLDRDGRFVLINDTELKMLGYTREEILGKKKFSDLLTAESLSTFQANFPRFKERGWVGDLEFQMLCKDGTILPVSLSAIAIKDAEGNFIMSRSTMIDISERKQAEAALYKSNSILNSVLESTPDIVFVKDLQNRYVIANSTAANFLGTTVEEMIGKDDNQLFPPEIAAQIIEADRAIIRTGKALVYQEVVPKQEKMETFLTVKCPWRDGEGNIIGAIGISRDISDRKEAEAALKQARDWLEIRVQERTKELSETNAALQVEIAERREAERKLEQLTLDLQRSNQELEQFAYLASHDLQEPLRAVTGYTELLQQEYERHLDETAKEYMGYIVDGATRMRQLIQDLLSYSRVGTRGKPFIPTDCNEALRQALNDLQVAIAENNAIITYDTLPLAIADKAQLAQLFQNLIGNAIKFRREEPPQIHIWAEPKDDLWVFGVRDNGIGIKPRYLERIFELFKRLHTRKEFPGTGIGLAICKKIVERHGGNIWTQSQPGVGTTFYFTLPKDFN
jgi:PAS domain S-box-containing protein